MRTRLSALVMVVVVSVALAGCSLPMPGERAAETYLKPGHRRMVVEIDYQEGKAPRQEAVNLLKTRILERCHKPDGVEIEQRQIQASQEVWTVDELKDLESRHRDHRTRGTTAALYIVYVGGGFEQDSEQGRVIGVMYTRTSIAIFKDNLERAANPVNSILPLFTAADVERSVLVHELGHVLGLVDLGTKMVRPHEDPEHPGHSNNKDSVMYWAIESSAVSRFFDGPPPTQFDANDIADLRAAGGK